MQILADNFSEISEIIKFRGKGLELSIRRAVDAAVQEVN